MQNLKFVFSVVPEILGGSQNLKSRSRDLGHAPFFTVQTVTMSCYSDYTLEIQIYTR